MLPSLLLPFAPHPCPSQHAQRLEALERAEDRVAELEKQVAVQQRAIARAEEEAEKSRAEAAARRGPVDPASLSKAQIGSLPLVQDLRRQVAQLESRCATVAMERCACLSASPPLRLRCGRRTLIHLASVCVCVCVRVCSDLAVAAAEEVDTISQQRLSAVVVRPPPLLPRPVSRLLTRGHVSMPR